MAKNGMHSERFVVSCRRIEAAWSKSKALFRPESFGDSSRHRVAISQRHRADDCSISSFRREVFDFLGSGGRKRFGVEVGAFVKTSSSLLTITGCLQETTNDNSSRAFWLCPAPCQLVGCPKNVRVVQRFTHLKKAVERKFVVFHGNFPIAPICGAANNGSAFNLQFAKMAKESATKQWFTRTA